MRRGFRPPRRVVRRVLPFVLLGVLLAVPAPAQQGTPAAQPPAPAPKSSVPEPLAKEAYTLPPKEIADAVMATRGEMVTLTNISPDGKKFLITKTDGLPPLQRMACPCVHLAEEAFDPVACRSRALWIRSADGFDLFFHADKRTVPVQIPKDARVSNPVWSPDGSKLAFFAHFPDATHICMADTDTGYCRRITTTPVLATLVTTFQWSKDGKRIQTVLLPDDGKREVPKPDSVAHEPKVRVARDGKDPARTYRYLLESPHDMRLLEHLVTGQLALIDVADGKVTKVGCPNMIRSVTTAPGESQFRVGVVKKPFSYYAPFTAFGSNEGIWDLEGKSLFTLNDRPLRDTGPPPADPTTQPVVATGAGATGPGGPGGPGGGGGRGGAGGGKGGNVGQPGAKQPNPTNPAPKQPVDPTDPTQPPVDPTNPDSPPFGPQAPVDPDGRRDLTWRPDGNGMSFLQLEPARAKDDKETRKDRVMQWLPPFGKDDAKVVFESPNRITAVQYSDDCQWLFVTQTVSNQRQVTALDMKDGKKPYVISGVGAPMGVEPAPMPKDKSLPDPADGDDDPDDEQQPKKGGGPGGFGAAAAAGGLMTRAVGTGVNVVRISSTGDVYMSGTATGAKPYIDAIDIKTGKKTRIFEGKYDGTETIAAVDGNDIKKVFTTREKADVPPDSFVTDLATGTVTKLTNNVDPAPWARKLKTERFQVTRVDGFKFWVRVTLPPNAPPKLPALFWIYPREYTDQAQYNAQAGRAPGTGGPAGAGGAGRFTTPGARAMSIVTLAGYALVEPDVPIVGPAGRMNDNYIPDLRNSLWAAIDECDKRGIIDRDRLACGGHSYGAFSTANAMAHTPFFKAGIAGDGCYNRTLTAMSFQSERRHIWDAREMYLEMSPLLWANRMNGALLMYHGMEDANVGTNPINAEMLYLALDGLGKDAALYMYPYEGHGPIAKETTLDLWARWVGWLDVYVKNPKKK